ncbi:MAG: exodeoxyribonuclease VII small subunit [Acidimicrobiia bacterium]|nr:exodeoxyribonuclease VII small subunit [Acidimicrobiia bacterium]
MTPTKTKQNKDISYKDAMAELETIVSKVEDRGVDIDELAQNVKRAHELITLCQKRIEAVRFEVENVMENSQSKASNGIVNEVEESNDSNTSNELF